MRRPFTTVSVPLWLCLKTCVVLITHTVRRACHVRAVQIAVPRSPNWSVRNPNLKDGFDPDGDPAEGTNEGAQRLYVRKLQSTRAIDEMLDAVGGCRMRGAGGKPSFAQAAVLVFAL